MTDRVRRIVQAREKRVIVPKACLKFLFVQNLKIQYKHENWQKIIKQIPIKIQEIEKKRTKPSKWKELRRFYSEMGEQFRFLKDAYRNYAMHVHQTYGREQAQDIFNSTKAFMQTLSGRLMEKKIV